MATLTSGPVEIHYEDTGGEGRPVVLIHGWPLSGASWSEQVPALTDAGYRVVTYDRRGFGRSGKPGTDSSYDYDTLTGDLDALMTELDLRDASLVGFSMGGGEVARYVGTYGEDRVRSIVLAAAIPPNLLKDDDHPDGALTAEDVAGLQGQLRADKDAFLDGFLTGFFSAGDDLKVTEAQRQDAARARRPGRGERRSRLHRLVGHRLHVATWPRCRCRCWSSTETPTASCPFEVSGQKAHAAVPGSELHVVEQGPHGINVSHAEEFNRVLLDFLAKYATRTRPSTSTAERSPTACRGRRGCWPCRRR